MRFARRADLRERKNKRGKMEWGKSSANILTITRLVMSPLAFVLILGYRNELGASWYLLVAGVLIGASDLFDGRLARRYKAISRWGTFLDPFADKVIVLGCALCFVLVDRYWALPVIILFAREVLIGGLRFYHVSKGYSVPATQLAKFKTTFQALALIAAAIPILKDYDILHVVLIWAAVATTLVTGVEYIIAIPKVKKANSAERKETKTEKESSA